MIVYIERARITEKQLTECGSGTIELQQQLTILKESIKLMEERTQLMKDKEKVQFDMMEMERKLFETKEKVYKQQIENAEPSFFEEVGKYTTGGVLGAAIVGLILLL